MGPDCTKKPTFLFFYMTDFTTNGERDVAVVREFAHGVMGRWIDPSW